MFTNIQAACYGAKSIPKNLFKENQLYIYSSESWNFTDGAHAVMIIIRGYPNFYNVWLFLVDII